MASVLAYPDGVTRRDRMIRALVWRWGESAVLDEGFVKSRSELKENLRRANPIGLGRWGSLKREAIVGSVMSFMTDKRRWPHRDEWRNSNYLPSINGVNACYYDHAWRLPNERRALVAVDGNGLSELQRDIAAHPDLKPFMALLLPNATHRRDAMARFKEEVLLKHMRLLDDDPEVGKLYQMTGQTMLRVVNSTPEPDGSHAIYVLPTPPDMTKARQALAWTFGVTDGWENFVVTKQT